MKLFNRIASAPYAILAALTIAMMTTEAHATNVGGVANTLTSQISNIGKFVVGAGALGGVFFLVAGLFRLKAHSDNPQQTKLGEAVWRIIVGTGLLAIPALATMMTGTFGVQATAVTPSAAF